MSAGHARRTRGLSALLVTRIVWLDSRARVLIEQETLKRPSVETGGALFGYENGGGLLVACAYGPGPRAKHRRASFEPDTATTQALMDAVRKTSGCRYRYLGSWHSHPGGTAEPSPQDSATAEVIATEPQVLLARPILVIQSTRLGSRGATLADLRAWRFEIDGLEPWEITPTEVDEVRCPTLQLRSGVRRRRHVLSPLPE